MLNLCKKISPAQWLEIFLISNIGFLAVDIWVAHSVNQFHHPSEWIPFFFSLFAAPLLLLSNIVSGFKIDTKVQKFTGSLVGFLAIAIGIAGMVFHLKSQFFQTWSLKGLVYTAPFIAPLAYVGLGFLTLMNRQITTDKKLWSQWILFFALGGFFGNFILALADHAQNDFYHWTEWIPVYCSAFAVGALLLGIQSAGQQTFRKFLWATLFFQIIVGVLGFLLHAYANLEKSGGLFEQFIYGAPLFAPLLFVNLALLGALGLYFYPKEA